MRVLHTVEIEPCKADAPPLRIRLVHPLSKRVNVDGVCVDGIWRIEAPKTVARYLRLFEGKAAAHGLESLLKHYAVRDASGCSYTGAIDGVRHTVLANAQQLQMKLSPEDRLAFASVRPQTVRRLYARAFPPSTHVPCLDTVRTMGMPQRTRFSGACWWGSLLWLLRVPPKLRRAFDSCLKESSTPVANEMRALLPLALSDPEAAARLHRRLHALASLGDAPDVPETEEGQNGYTQLCMLASLIGMPAQTILAPSMRDVSTATLRSKHTQMPPPRRPTSNEPAFLGVRVMRKAWKPPLRLRIAGSERVWVLQGAFLGSEFCGHQTAFACGSCPRTFTHYDSDACRLGVGAVSWKSKAGKWWHDMEHALLYSVATSTTKFCDFTPRNRHVMTVSHDHLRAQGIPLSQTWSTDARDESIARSLNVDYVYA